MEGAASGGQGTRDPAMIGGDLCAAYIPVVFGGWLDPWTYKEPGSWRGTEWPCPGAVNAGAHVITCTCGHHRGEFEHELPAGSDPRTGVHPTEVLADQRKFWGGGG